MVEDGLGGARDWSAADQGAVAESVRAGTEMSSCEVKSRYLKRLGFRTAPCSKPLSDRIIKFPLLNIEDSQTVGSASTTQCGSSLFALEVRRGVGQQSKVEVAIDARSAEAWGSILTPASRASPRA